MEVVCGGRFLSPSFSGAWRESTSGDNTRSIINQSQMGEQEQVTAVMEDEKVIKEEDLEVKDPEPVLDIIINNVVSSFSVACHLDLHHLALHGNNVELRKENGVLTMKLRKPPTTASIWSSGKITCTGSTSESQARLAGRRIARCVQKMGYNVKFRNFRIVNVLGTCSLPFAIKITPFSQKHRDAASYEPELHPGVTYRIEHPKATLKIFSTGSITVTAGSFKQSLNAC
ncbi:TATA box-binding protein-like 1 isoform X6 [Portunus trituberculatus]|uniref:TATA box-binding protein-like 1 isoform X6 n=1 Tax=Portunus trituberculatus TaxID=210409 RepID=UPI001E1CF7AE|nr:TATA box-binding protein-like 1 isoform X6 [Portunus trituberculatus]